MARVMNDIALDSNNDTVISTGDFGIVESTYAHQKQLLLSNKGMWKENPNVGVGVQRYQDDEGDSGVLGEINRQFAMDGMNRIAQSGDGVGDISLQWQYV